MIRSRPPLRSPFSPGRSRFPSALCLPFLAVVPVAAPASLTAQAATPVAPDLLSSVPGVRDTKLPLPAGLVPQVEFWKAIYSRVSRHEVLFHDRERMDVVYEKVRAPEARTPADEVFNRNLLQAKRGQYQAALRALGEGFDPDTLSGLTLRVYEAWGDGTTADRFLRAADEVRWQRGLRERFIEGLAYSGRYQPHVEQVFREEGVPLELTVLPFVESMYNIHAYSSAGAAGIWQFMPGTGRLFMRVDGTIDERMDPLRAARAAARLLRQNHERLGTWPLAITAYNHGTYGMSNAVRTMGTRDIERIVKGYAGRGFGFASRNFYTEFLAALAVRREQTTHFGDVRLDPVLEFEEVTAPAALKFSTLARALALPVEALWDLNPAFTPNARRQDRPIPAGHRLRLPLGSAPKWGEALASLRAAPGDRALRNDAPPGRSASAWYVVRRGDTLGGIAERHGVALSSLRALNGLSRQAVIRPGQRIRLAR